MQLMRDSSLYNLQVYFKQSKHMKFRHILESHIPTTQTLNQSNQSELQEQKLQLGKQIILFIIIGLFAGGALRQLSKKTRIPFTPMLLVLGILLGYFYTSMGFIGESSKLVGKINPHVMLLVFIPILIFQSAFNCEWHVFRKSLGSIVLLAGPGVLIGSLMIGATLKLVLGYSDEDMKWSEAMVLGAVLSATDPVAVVSLLKQLGASTRFNTLVEGQSLLNDGTAMVFLGIFMKLAQGQSSSFGGTVTEFVRTSFGGPLLGFLVGLLISLWLKFVVNDSILSINITFFAAYFCYYIAEYSFLKVSGILSIVVLGLYMSSVGKHNICPESFQNLHHVWGYIQYICETLIFIITGIIVGLELISPQSSLYFPDYLKMFVFWFLMIIIRAILMFAFYPLLNRMGYGINRRQLIVLIYGGLRGSLGLCLALTVNSNGDLPERFRQLTLLYMCGMATMTIIINGLTCGFVVNWVSMIVYPQSKRKLFYQCAHNIISTNKNKLNSIKDEPSVVYADWREVQRLAQINNLGDIHFDEKLQQEISSIENNLKELNTIELQSEVRFRFVLHLQKSLMNAYENGEVSEESYQKLKEACNVALDGTNSFLSYFDVLSQNFPLKLNSFAMKFENWPLLGTLVSMYVPNSMYDAYEMATVFIEVAEESIHEFEDTFPLQCKQIDSVMKQVRDNIEAAVNYIVDLQHDFPTIIRPVHTLKASNIILYQKKHKLKEMFDEGFLDRKQYTKLTDEITRKQMMINFHKFELAEVDFGTVLTEHPLFTKMPASEINKIRTFSKEKHYGKGAHLFEKGIMLDSIFFIVSGSVEQYYEEQELFFMKGACSFIDPYDFTYGEKSKASARTLTDTKIMEIPGNLVLQFLNKYSAFRQRWFKTLFPYSLNFCHSSDQINQFFTSRLLRDFIEQSQIVTLRKSNTVELDAGGFLFKGEVQILEKYKSHQNHQTSKQEEGVEKYVFMRDQFIKKGQKVIALESSIIMKFARNLQLPKHHHQIIKF